MSRGGNRPGHRGRAPVDFQFYGSLRGLRETGLLALRVDDEGEIPAQTVHGVQAEFGLYGAHQWRRSTLGVDYRGDYRRSSARIFDGTNQALSLQFTHTPTNRWSLLLSQTAGTTNRAFGGFLAPTVSNFDRPGIPLTEVFDRRAYFGQSTASVAYRKSARATLAATIDGFLVKRTSRLLINMQGGRAAGQYSYRLNRRDTVAAVYSFTRFEFPRVFGSSDIHTYGGMFQRDFTRNLHATVTAGVYRADVSGTREVIIAPEIAAILGRNAGIEAFRDLSTSPQFDATVTYTMQRGSLNFGASRGVSAGNGVFLTSKQTSASAGYSYTGIRRLSMGISSSFARAEQLGRDMGAFTIYGGGGGMSYALTRGLNFNAQIDGRRQSAPALRGRSGYTLSVGFAYGSETIPISIW